MIASGNHLLTQVKDNQPSLRRRLELGVAGRKPSGSAKTETTGRNRWETRELTVFPAKAWFRDTPWEKLIKTVLRLERTVCKRAPATGLCAQTTEVVFWISSASNQMPQRWNEWIRAHCGGHRDPRQPRTVRDTAFVPSLSRLPASARSPRHRRSPTILRLQSDPAPLAARTSETLARWRRPRSSTSSSIHCRTPPLTELIDQPCKSRAGPGAIWVATLVRRSRAGSCPVSHLRHDELAEVRPCRRFFGHDAPAERSYRRRR